MKYDNKYLKIFSNCLFFYGNKRTLLVDIHNNSFITIPNTFHEFILYIDDCNKIKDAYGYFGLENVEVLDEYIDFIISNNIGFICSKLEFKRFPKLNLNYEDYLLIENCIIEYSEYTNNYLDKILNLLETINCKIVQIINYNLLELTEYESILNKIEKSKISFEIISKYCSSNFKELVDRSLKTNVRTLIFHSTNMDYFNFEYDDLIVTHINSEVESFKYCGMIAKFYFNVNKNKVLESLNHNSCLHKKISIDKDGNIKNCPSMAESFGNIKDTTLEEALNKPNFKKYWNITKDQIEVCKDCEFRHICTDCRAYIENPEDQYSKPLKCGYNPYTCEWEEWSTNPLKQKAIEYYGMQDLVKKDA